MTRPVRAPAASGATDGGQSEATGGADGPSSRPITDRQLEILVHVARGRTNRQIGEILGISERTVRNHLRTTLKKLASTDRTRAVVIAIERGWIPIPIEPDGYSVAVPIDPPGSARRRPGGVLIPAIDPTI